MHTPSYSYQADYELDYAVDFSRRNSEPERRRRRPSYSRGSRPAMVNGIFRRRHKRISW
ncbi:MAG TPA: hypothetical protein VG056_06255 [Pirellulales bacterium]|jgi:hypothetical protein|nr:hypothetical protein [Pirellulales bacterium]HEV3416393.1 hypothetical protein [Pirellulales bacterium]